MQLAQKTAPLLCLMILTALGLTAARPVAAQNLNGQIISVDYLYGSTIFSSGGAQTVTSAGANYFFGFTNDNEVLVTPSQLFITSSDVTNYVSGSFNGYHLAEIGGTPVTFTSVSVDPTTNVPGFSSSMVTFDPTNIYVNLAGLEVTGRQNITLNITTEPAAVPEASTTVSFGLLLALGMGGLGVAAKRKKADAAA